MAKKKKSSPLPTTAVCEDKAAMRRYQAEDDLRTLQKAEDIGRDKSRLSAAGSLAKEQMEALKRVAK